MLNAKLILLGMLVMFAVGLMPSATASAYEFSVEGETVGESAGTKDEHKGGTGVLQLESTIANGKVVLECDAGSATTYLGEDGESAIVLTAKSCSAYKVSKGSKEALTSCAVAPIELDLDGELASVETASVVEMAFATAGSEPDGVVELTGSTCTLKGKYVIAGSQSCSLPEGEREEVHVIDCTSTGSGLELGEEAASLFINLAVGITFHVQGPAETGPIWRVGDSRHINGFLTGSRRVELSKLTTNFAFKLKKRGAATGFVVECSGLAFPSRGNEILGGVGYAGVTSLILEFSNCKVNGEPRCVVAVPIQLTVYLRLVFNMGMTTIYGLVGAPAQNREVLGLVRITEEAPGPCANIVTPGAALRGNFAFSIAPQGTEKEVLKFTVEPTPPLLETSRGERIGAPVLTFENERAEVTGGAFEMNLVNNVRYGVFASS